MQYIGETNVIIYGDKNELVRLFDNFVKGINKEISCENYETHHLIYTLLASGYIMEEISSRRDLLCNGSINEIGFNNDGSIFLNYDYVDGGGLTFIETLLKEKYNNLKFAGLVFDYPKDIYYIYDLENKYFRYKYTLEYCIDEKITRLLFEDNTEILRYLNEKFNWNFKTYEEVFNYIKYSDYDELDIEGEVEYFAITDMLRTNNLKHIF